MARRRIEMYEYRQALMRMRQGDSEREIARSKLMGRSKASRFRELAHAQGWLDPARPVPTDAEIAAVLGQPRLPVSAQSSIAAYRTLVEQWMTQGVSGVVIHATLAREHGFTWHYSSVRRLIAQIGRDRTPEATVRLSFAPGEAGVKYVKGNFLPARSFRDLADLNAQVCDWVLKSAGQRIHGTTRVKPLESFSVERSVLLPLPAVPPDLGTWHAVSVHRDCHISFERALYSVPFALVGKRLWLRATDSVVTVYQDFAPVAIHARARRPGERCTVADHLPVAAQRFFAHDRAWCVQQASEVGEACARLVGRLLSDRISERLRAAQGVLQFKTRYGAARLEAACARALAHDSPHYRTVKTILAGGHDLTPLEPTTASPYAGNARFARGAASLCRPVWPRSARF